MHAMLNSSRVLVAALFGLALFPWFSRGTPVARLAGHDVVFGLTVALAGVALLLATAMVTGNMPPRQRKAACLLLGVVVLGSVFLRHFNPGAGI